MLGICITYIILHRESEARRQCIIGMFVIRLRSMNKAKIILLIHIGFEEGGYLASDL